MILAENTKLMTSDGLISVNDVKAGDFIINCTGQLKAIKSVEELYYSTIKLKTSKGRLLSCKNVNLFSLNDGFHSLKLGSDIYFYHNVHYVDKSLNIESYLIGWLLGDGYYGKFSKVRELYFMVNSDEVSHLEIMLLKAGYSIKPSFDSGGCAFYYLYGDRAEEIINKGLFYNIDRAKSLDWTRFNRNQILNILRGFFDSDGSVRLKKTHRNSACIDITHSSKSSQVELDLQLALSCLGIKSRVHCRHRVDKRGFEFDTADLQVYSSSSRLVAQNIQLFVLERKRELLHSKSERGNPENKKSTETLSLENIEELETGAISKSYKIEVEGDCLIANGLCLTK